MEAPSKQLVTDVLSYQYETPEQQQQHQYQQGEGIEDERDGGAGETTKPSFLSLADTQQKVVRRTSSTFGEEVTNRIAEYYQM